MKKYSLFFPLISFSAFSQTPVVQTGFDNYVGTSASAPAGWYMSWHSTSSPSYYTSAGNFGASSPSYKMGQDSVIVVSPKYSGADTLTFWCKGNGVPFGNTNELHIYYSSDSISWVMFVNRDSLPVAGTTLKYALPNDTGWVKFEYRKLGTGNLAFDDVNLLSYVPIGISENNLSEIFSVFPTISSGQFKVQSSRFNVQRVEAFDVIGSRVFYLTDLPVNSSPISIDLSNQKEGIYFVKIKTDGGEVTKKVVVSK